MITFLFTFGLLYSLFLLVYLLFWFLCFSFILFVFLLISSFSLSGFNLFRSQFDFLLFLFIFLFFFWSFLLHFLWPVLEVESCWKLEIKLTSTALMLPSKGIEKFKINFWTIEGSIPFVNFVLFSKFSQCSLKLRFSNIPLFNLSQKLFRSGGQLNFVFEAKDRINVINEVQYSNDFFLNLIGHAENMSIILLESSDSSQSW